MKRISPAIAVIAAAAVVLFLSSCAPAVHPAAGGTSHPHVTVKPHPTPTQPAIPAVRVPVTCASLLTDTAVTAMIGSPIKSHTTETTPVVDITDVAARQYGTLDCVWGGDREDSGYDQDLTIDISPDARAGFESNLSGFGNEDPPVTTNTVGDQSIFGCSDSDSLHCSGNMLVGNYWVTVYIQDLDGSPVPIATANSNTKQVLTTVAAALKNAKAAKAWNPPAGALPSFCASDASTAQVNTALGVTDFASVGEDDAETDAGSYPQLDGVYTQCAWGTASESGPFSYLSIAMLKGGAWVLPQLPGEQNPKAYMLNEYESMTIPGATAAAGDCSVDADECEVALSLGSNLVVIGMDDTNDALASAALAKVVAAIKAS